MMLYLVRWEIDVEADSPREAAEMARCHQFGCDAEMFDVYEYRDDAPPVKRACVDLTYPEETVECDGASSIVAKVSRRESAEDSPMGRGGDYDYDLFGQIRGSDYPFGGRR